MSHRDRAASACPETVPARKPPGNRVRRTPEVQAERDRVIPRPPDGSGLSCVGPNDWLPVWHEVAAKPPVKVTGYALLKFADYWDGANIRPTEVVLAEMTQQSTRTVEKALAQIREWGLLWRYVDGRAYGRQGKASEYRLTIPDDLTSRVPLVVTVAALPEHPNDSRVIGADHANDVRVIVAEHPNVATGTPEPDGTEHPNEVRTTFIRDLSITSSSPGVPVAAASVEGGQQGARDGGREVPDSSPDSAAFGQCGYAQCRIRTPVPPGRGMHEGCERFATLKAKAARPSPPQPAVPAERQRPMAS